MALTFLPKSILLKHKSFDHSFFAYKDGTVSAETANGVFNPLARIEIEKAKINSDYIHLRFIHSNKYWSRKDGLIVAESTKPEEDIKKATCTMFKATDTADAGGVFQLVHVQSGFFVQAKTSSSQVEAVKAASEFSKLSFLDLETVVNLPKRLALKSNNKKFLKATTASEHTFSFTSDDPKAATCSLEIQQLPSGHIRVKSDYYQQYWQCGDAFYKYKIWAVSSQDETDKADTLFWPIRIDDRKIALRSLAYNRYCGRSSGESDHLTAAADSVTEEARFEVQELVEERKIYDVKYRVEELRIYDSMPFVAGSVTLRNETEKEMTLSSKLVYEEETSNSISRSESVKTGLRLALTAEVPDVVKGELQWSREQTVETEWEQKTTTKTVRDALATATVPGRSSMKMSYMGSKGKFSIPFSYWQRDVDAATAKVTVTQHSDGVYHGEGSLEVQFVAEKPVPLPV